MDYAFWIAFGFGIVIWSLIVAHWRLMRIQNRLDQLDAEQGARVAEMLGMLDWITSHLQDAEEPDDEEHPFDYGDD